MKCSGYIPLGLPVNMAVQILKERHPKVVVFHWRDEVGLAGEGDSALFKFTNGKADVRALFGLALNGRWSRAIEWRGST